MITIQELQNIINSEIEKESERLFSTNPQNLYAPIKYTLEMGGKRIRPVMVLLSYSLFKKNIENAIPAALAIELFHNFTLLHDDIMDAADIRRNKPTVHKKFSNNSAILSGDAMSFISFQYLLKSKSGKIQEVSELFANTAVEVCEGQQLDMDFENRLDVTEEEYIEMIRLKTAVLLACSLKIGAMLADVSGEVPNKLYDFGLNLGLAFQLQDDLLDTFGDEKIFGKKIGGDITSNKKTFLLIKALELANERQKSELLYWVKKNEFNPTEKINSVITIYNQLDIESLVRERIDIYFNKATSSLNDLQISSDQKEQLLQLSQSLLKRNR